ncbi:stress-induced protein [Salmonella enterica]|uniref:stress-induced protein n=1 Tax=Salmonella enterica TaxID=28901 RepID=UPI000D7525EB|nr:stress-induced protein [Salmonella enterica]PXU56659.1 stress-induced protein [Salmonella enterica subsp. enterica serovar Newport]
MANHRGGSGYFSGERERESGGGRKGGGDSGGDFKKEPQRGSGAGEKGGKRRNRKS